MATCDLASGSPRITLRPAVATRVLAAAAGFYRNWKNRRAFNCLGEMTDAQLADIGLTRADLSFAALPFGADPTQRLGAIAAERMRCGLGVPARTC